MTTPLRNQKIGRCAARIAQPASLGHSLPIRNFGVLGAGHRFFMQQQLSGLYSAIIVEPALYRAITKKISQGEETHSLMVSHPAADYFVARPAEAAAEDRI